MATYDQSPGRMNLVFKRGDTFSTQLDFSVSVTGYQFSSRMYSTVTNAVIQEFTVAITSAAEGKVTISLTALQTLSLPAGTYAWGLSWTEPAGLVRTVLSGFAEVV